MKTLYALTIAAASLVALPFAAPALAIDSSISAKCGPEGPEAYKRPGGFCDQLGTNSSLSKDNEDCKFTIVPTPSDVSELTTILVAANCLHFYGSEVQ